MSGPSDRWGDHARGFYPIPDAARRAAKRGLALARLEVAKAKARAEGRPEPTELPEDENR